MERMMKAMDEIEELIHSYQRYVQLPWDRNLAGPQKVWFALYEPAQERRLRFRVDEFAEATRLAQHIWELFDLTDTFATWMAQHEYREAYFEEPEDMNPALSDFMHDISLHIIDVLARTDENTVVALLGLSSLFGLTLASAVFKEITPSIRGRLLVFFPGQHRGSIYRLLDAHDNWDYLAVPITGVEGK
jgi:hypothetical protein